MSDQSSDTKQKILEKARILFAEQGFEGTSVREIAKAAGVNVASLNYHYTTKEALFKEILDSGYKETSKAIRDYYHEHSPSLEDLLVYVYQYLIQNPHDMISFFKMIMSRQHSQKFPPQESAQDQFGLPGSDTIVEAVQKEVGSSLSGIDQQFAVKCLFYHVVHSAILFNCYYNKHDVPYTSSEEIEQTIRRLCQVVVKDLKK